MNSKKDTSDDLQDELEEEEMERNAVRLVVADKMWNNDIIWREITSYLNISDLKDISLVNKFFLQRVRSLTRFTSLATQVVTGNMEIRVFQLTTAIVEVNKIKEIVLKKRAAKTFKNTEYLEIQHLNGLSTEVLNARLIHIVSNCPKLKSLAFFIGGILDLDAFFTNTKVKLVLSNLKELYLDVKKGDWRNLKWETLFEQEELRERLEMFKSLFPDLPIKLTSFSCKDYRWFHLTSLSPADFLMSSQSTLVKLNLNIPFNNSSLADLNLKTLRFPKLEKLTLTIKYKIGFACATNKSEKMARKNLFATHVLLFFQNHFSSLRKFDLRTEDVVQLEPFCEMLNSSTKIETFVLRSSYPFDPRPSQIDWTFLKNITTLRRFELNVGSGINNLFSGDTSGSFLRYLNVLPPNVELIDYRPLAPRIPVNNYYQNIAYAINTNELSSSLLEFQGITALTLCLPLEDSFLQLICKNLTNLLIFKANLSGVTDFGISGVSVDENIHSGISLANLKGLRKFHITQDLNDEPLLITWDGLIRSIHFLEMVELIVDSQLSSDEQNQEVLRYEAPSREIDEQKFLALVSKVNNPSLEKVYFLYYQATEYIFREVKLANPRIKSCIFYGSNC